MTRMGQVQFLVLMIPTFVILVAAAVSVADLSGPPSADPYSVARAEELVEL
jgi:hypothetical protein